MVEPLDRGVVDEADAAPDAGLRQPTGELVDVAGGVRRREEPAVEVAGQGRLDRADFFRRHGAAVEPAFRQHVVDLRCVVEALAVAVEVQDAARFQVEVDAFALRHVEQVLARLDGEPRGRDGVGAVLGDVADELGHPGILVPVGRRVHQERRVALEHPGDALDDRGPVVPNLGIAGGKLPAIGEGSFHRGVALPVEHGDGVAFFGQRVGGGDARDAGADNCDMGGAVTHGICSPERVRMTGAGRPPGPVFPICRCT